MSIIDRRFRNPLEKKRRRGFRGYPLATIAYYGPDDERASKVAVGIVRGKGQRPAEFRRWHSEQGDVRRDPAIDQEIVEFIQKHDVRSVVGMDRIIGCPHEEGIDYPDGQPCPACPYWAHRDRFSGQIVH
jgi:hypothetical protein